MKRIVLLSLFLLLTVSGCTAANEEAAPSLGNQAVNESDLPSEQEAPPADNDAGNEAEERAADEAVNEPETARPNALADFAEADLLTEHIPELATFTQTVTVDTRQKRIILFKDGQQVYYKSIYLKHKNHLKIINTHANEALLYNGVVN